MPIVTANKAELYYEAHGEGPALVFAHGGGGNAAIWYQQVPHFVDRYRVITFDHRGFGRSSAAADDVRADHFGDDMVRILDDASVERAVIVAQSMGGWTAILTAIAHPDRVAGVVMGNTPGPVMTPEIAEARASIEARVTSLGGLAGLAVSADLPERDPAKAFLYAQISGFNPGYPLDTEKLMVTVGDEVLARLDVPIIMIVTDGDALLPAPALRSAAPALNAKVYEITGSGHSPYFEKPDEFNAIVDRFLVETGW